MQQCMVSWRCSALRFQLIIMSQKAVRGCVHDAKLHQAPRYACIGVMHSAVIGLGTYAAFTMRISQKVYLYHMMPQ